MAMPRATKRLLELQICKSLLEERYTGFYQNILKNKIKTETT